MNIDKYEKPIWDIFCRVLGVICFLIFSYSALGQISENRRMGYDDLPQSAMVSFGLAVGSVIHFFFIAWCVQTFADIRHYARETAIALTSGKEEKAEDTKPNASQAQ